MDRSRLPTRDASFLTTLALLAVFLCAPLLALAADTGQIAVIIRGAKKAGVTVTLSGGDLAEAQEKRTNKFGRVSFKELAAGVYALTPRKSGASFTPSFKTLTVSADATARATFSSASTGKNVGMAYCMSCHEKLSPDVYADWLAGPHGNFDYRNGDAQTGYDDFADTSTYPTGVANFSGYPNSSTIAAALQQSEYAGKTEKYCLECHGPSTADNAKVANFSLVRPEGIIDTVNASSQVARPVVGCEACHGSGRSHISHPTKGVTHEAPTAAQCGQCHNNQFPSPHLDAHPLGAGERDNPGIYEAYLTSPHADSVDDAELYTDAAKTTMKAECAKCHSDHGARIYRSIDGDGTTLPQRLVNEAGHTEFAAVQCRTCHDAHNPSQLLETASAATSSATARSAEFNLCTNCHQLLDSSDAKLTNPYHADHTGRITDTHYDNPTTTDLEGYNVKRSSETACSDCHNPHRADTTINKQWAESGHGDLTAKPWKQYDWKSVGRQSCQRCHSPVGFAAIVADQENYNAANNNFSHLTGTQDENLHCNGCHKNGSSERRTIGAYNGFVKFPSGDKVSLDADSNLCMMCHQGRASKLDVDTKISGGSAPYTSFTNIHYLAAAATFFGTETRGGYEYSGKTYVTRNTFEGHEGRADTCVECHLRTESADAPDHHFLPQVTDCAGSGCHVGLTDFDNLRPSNVADYDGDSDTTEGLKGEVDTMRAALYTQIKSYAASTVLFPAVYDGSTNPYWFRDTNGNGVKDSNETTGYNKFDAKLLKAAYNYHVSVQEPHGYIHNHRYILQLLYDSLQDLGATMTPYTRPQ